MRRWLAVAAMAVSIHASAACVEQRVKSVTGDGEILVTQSGKVFEIVTLGEIDVRLWLSGDELIICGPREITLRGKKYAYYTVINSDDKEKVEAIRLK